MEKLDLKLSGLWTSANPFSKAPDGAAEVADNVVIRDPGLVQPRRGYTATTAPPNGQNISRVFPWQSRLMVVTSSGTMYDFSDANGWNGVPNGSGFGGYGFFFNPPDSSNPVRAATAQKSIWLTSSNGVFQVEQFATPATKYSATRAGLPAPTPAASPTLTKDNVGCLKVGYSAAYRAVVARYDANNNLIQSAPSARIVATNSGQAIATGSMSKPTGSQTVTITFPAAHGLSANDSIDIVLGGAETYFNGGTFQVASVTNSTVLTYNDGLTQSSGSTQTNSSLNTVAGGHMAPTIYWDVPYPSYQTSTSWFAMVFRSPTTNNIFGPSDECFQIQEISLAPAATTFSCNPDETGDSFLSVPLYTNANTGSGITAQNSLPPLARDLCAFQGYMLYANTTERHSLSLQLIGTSGLSNGSTVVIAGVTYTAAATENTVSNQFQLLTTGSGSLNIETTAKSLCRCINYNAESAGGAIRAFYTSTGSTDIGKIFLQEAGIGGAAFTFNAGQDGQTCWMPDCSKASYVQTSSNNRTPGKIWWSNLNQPWGVPPNNWAIVGAADQPILRIINVRQTVFIFKTDGLFTLTLGGSAGSPFTIQPFDPGLVLLAPESCAVVGNQIFCLTNRGVVYVTESGVSPAVSSPIELDISSVMFQFNQYPTVAFGVPDEAEGAYLLALPASPTDTLANQQYVFDTDQPNWTRWTLPGVSHGAFNPATQSLVWAVGNALWEERKTFTSADFQDPTGPINCTYKLLPISGGDPTREKAFDQILLSFRRAEFTSATLGFDSERLNTTSSVTKAGAPSPIWGSFPWGMQPWGVAGKNYILRVNQPQGTALSATLGMTFSTSQSGVLWQLQGVSIWFTPTAQESRR